MKRIIQDLILGDEMVFKNLVKENQARVYHHAMQILRNREEAEDVCQETFIQVFESINDFKGESESRLIRH
jgi:RNA polymerase sigma-70 factor (ECF subfamily)